MRAERQRQSQGFHPGTSQDKHRPGRRCSEEHHGSQNENPPCQQQQEAYQLHDLTPGSDDEEWTIYGKLEVRKQKSELKAALSLISSSDF